MTAQSLQLPLLSRDLAEAVERRWNTEPGYPEQAQLLMEVRTRNSNLWHTVNGYATLHGSYNKKGAAVTRYVQASGLLPYVALVELLGGIIRIPQVPTGTLRDCRTSFKNPEDILDGVTQLRNENPDLFDLCSRRWRALPVGGDASVRKAATICSLIVVFGISNSRQT